MLLGVLVLSLLQEDAFLRYRSGPLDCGVLRSSFLAIHMPAMPVLLFVHSMCVPVYIFVQLVRAYVLYQHFGEKSYKKEHFKVIRYSISAHSHTHTHTNACIIILIHTTTL